jgi:predicted RNA-binding protein with PIN domain
MTTSAAGDASEGSPPDDPSIPDASLRDVLTLAVGVAAAGRKVRPPLSSPVGLKPLLGRQRLDRMGLRAARRALDADPGFRRRLAAVVTEEQAGEIGHLWLTRPAGWRRRAADLLAATRAAAEEASSADALRRAERRRDAAEQAAARAAAEVASLQVALAQTASERDAWQRESAAIAQRAERLERELGDAQERLAVAQARRSAGAAERDELLAQLDQLRVAVAEAERVRDAVLADRADAAETPAPAAAAAEPPVPRSRATRRRTPLALPGGVYGNSLAAAQHLLTASAVRVVVDGYNVAKLGWPALALDVQRERCIAAAEDVARRTAAAITVVFDGAGVVGATATRRRTVRVVFSPPGVTADDVIRAEVAAVPAQRPVVVVTDDQAVVADVRGAGANVVPSAALLALSGHTTAF